MFKIFDLFSDTGNKRIFPSPTFVTPGSGNWYALPGYAENSPFLTFDVPGYKWLYNGQKFRVWYGEDLVDFTEHDNVGQTCMNVDIYTLY